MARSTAVLPWGLALAGLTMVLAGCVAVPYPEYPVAYNAYGYPVYAAPPPPVVVVPAAPIGYYGGYYRYYPHHYWR